MVWTTITWQKYAFLFFWSAIVSADLCQVKAPAKGSSFPDLERKHSSHGQLQISLDFVPVRFQSPSVDITTRSFNCTIPSPTLILQPGDHINITLRNGLSGPNGLKAENLYHHPNITNLHTHGLHVSEKAPSDDILTVQVMPGGLFQYTYHFSKDHSPGTYWVHPHWHGAETLQAGAGAAFALIVADPPNFLSKQLAAMEDRLLVFQHLVRASLESAAAASQDRLFHVHRWDGHGEVRLVNGVEMPTLKVKAAQWLRLRFVHAGLEAWLNLDFTDNCSVVLLAKDGVYIHDFPRKVGRVTLPPGGRCDLIVQCTRGTHHVNSQVNTKMMVQGMSTSQPAVVGPIFTIDADGTPTKAEDLQPWSPKKLPDYLKDTLSSNLEPTCTCDTGFMNAFPTDDFLYAIQGRTFRGPDSYLNKWPRNSIVERRLVGVELHPFHQHTFPFQLVNPPSGDPFFKPGDWHDTYFNSAESTLFTAVPTNVRFNTVDFDGRMVLHCHDFVHADMGMMAVDVVDDVCSCDILEMSRHGWVLSILSIVGCLSLCALLMLCCAWKRIMAYFNKSNRPLE